MNETRIKWVPVLLAALCLLAWLLYRKIDRLPSAEGSGSSWPAINWSIDVTLPPQTPMALAFWGMVIIAGLAFLKIIVSGLRSESNTRQPRSDRHFDGE